MRIKVRSAARRFAFFGALTMIVGLGVASAASATQVPIWSQNGTHLPFGTEVAFSAPAITGMNLQWTQGGMHYWIQCESMSASGTVEDYASGVAGTLKPTPEGAKFEGCKVVEVGPGQTAWNNTTCTVPKNIPFKYASGALTNSPYPGGGLKLSGVELSFIISKCPSNFNEGIIWRFWGDLTGNEGHGAWPGEILFPEGTPLSMNLGGSEATIDFGMNVQGPGFTPIKVIEEEIVAPHNPGHHYWYTGGGMRKGEGARTLAPPGSPVAIKGNGASISILGSLSGIKTQVSCNGATTTGSVENPAGGGDGTANVGFTFTGCTVPQPAGQSCYIEGGSFTTNTVPGVLQNPGASAPMALTGIGSGKSIAVIPIRGCTSGSLNNNFPLTGTLLVSPYLSLANPNSWFISYSLNEASKLLKFAGVTASAGGSVKAETTGGEAITWTE